MKEIGYEEYYNSIYSGLSFESHGLNATMGISADRKGLSLKCIRNPENGRTTFELACNFSINVLQKIYQYLGDEKEMAEFENFRINFTNERNIAGHNLDMIRSAPSIAYKE